MRQLFYLLFSLLMLLTCACATVPKQAKRLDPLIGTIVKADTGACVTFTQLVDALAQTDVIYLSEKHDNPMHHAFQHRIIQTLIDQGRAPSLGFEFFSSQDTPLLLNFVDASQKAHSLDMEKTVETQMRKKLGWDTQPDQMWQYYWSLMQLAAANHLTAAGLDLSAVQKRRITRKGLEGLFALELQQIFSTRLANPAYEDYMKSIFVQVHCGMDHGRMTDRLYDTWMARNDRMALSVVQLAKAVKLTQVNQNNRKPGPVVVIIGGGHTEYGLGVIDRVNAIDPGISQVNLGMTEISREPAELTDYLAPLDLEGFKPVPPADFLLFTQRVSYEDPCAKFKESLKKMKTSGTTPAKNSGDTP